MIKFTIDGYLTYVIRELNKENDLENILMIPPTQIAFTIPGSPSVDTVKTNKDKIQLDSEQDSKLNEHCEIVDKFFTSNTSNENVNVESISEIVKLYNEVTKLNEKFTGQDGARLSLLHKISEILEGPGFDIENKSIDREFYEMIKNYKELNAGLYFDIRKHPPSLKEETNRIIAEIVKNTSNVEDNNINSSDEIQLPEIQLPEIQLPEIQLPEIK